MFYFFYRNIPNLVSLLRIAFMPFIIWLLAEGELLIGFWVLFFVGMTDLLDGFLARRLGLSSEVGLYLDPVADKMLLVPLYVFFLIEGYLPVWLSILVCARDIFIIIGVIAVWSKRKFFSFSPLFWGKISTLFQNFLPLVALGEQLGNPLAHWLLEPFITSVTFLTIVSGFLYLLRWYRSLRSGVVLGSN